MRQSPTIRPVLLQAHPQGRWRSPGAALRRREKTNRIHRGPRDRNGSLGANVVGERHALPRSCTTSVVAERSLSDQLTDSLVSCRRNEWPSGVRQRSPNPTCGEAPGSGDKPRHLPRRLAVGHSTEPRPHCRKNGYFDLMLRGSVVGVDRQQGGPGGAVDLVGPFDAPRDPHRRDVGQKRNCRVAGGQRRSGDRARQLLSGT